MEQLKKIGYVHIPKCAGTSLSKTIYSSLGLKPLHIHSLLNAKHDKMTPYCVVINSSSMKTMQNSPFLSGHINYSQMAMMKREFIFTCLRDPYSRFFSHYTYNVSRSLNPDIVKNHPALKPYSSLSFMESKLFSPNAMFNYLTSHTGMSFKNKTNEMVSLLEKSLKKFDVIYFSDMQFVLDNLNDRGLIPKCHQKSINESVETLELNMGCTEDEFLDILEQHCWMDNIACNIAAKLFPETVVKSPSSPEQFLYSIKKRHKLNFK